MCTSDCRCYEGDRGEIKEKWQAYGNDVLQVYQRNAQDKNVVINGKTTFPLKWTSDRATAVFSFK